MISIIVCHKDLNHLNEFKKSVKDTIGNIEYEIIVIDNSHSNYYLTGAYNEGMQKSIGDILVFSHEDIRFETVGWGKILEEIFKKNKNIGVLGVAGTEILLQNAQWWNVGSKHMYGEVIHESNGSIYKTIFSEGSGEKEVVVLDGLFMCCRSEVVKKENIVWDEDFDHYHFYDLSFCVPFLQKGYKNYVTYNILVKHFGMGNMTAEWDHYRHVFINKFKDILPLKTRDDVNFDGNAVQWKTETIKED